MSTKAWLKEAVTTYWRFWRIGTYLSTAPSNYILGGPWTRLYYRWKAVQFPWRKRYFRGMDLKGNTFWEFRERLHAHRPRRIVDFRGGVHSLANYADLKVDPQWLQWLRATRENAPTLLELRLEEIRQMDMVELARLVDEHWDRKGSRVKDPDRDEINKLMASALKTAISDGSQAGSSSSGSSKPEAVPAEFIGQKRTRRPVDTTVERLQERLKAEQMKNSKEKGRPSAPSEGFQPEAWNPNVTKKKTMRGRFDPE